MARAEGVQYGGIDSSPAPLGDDSIGAAIEALSGAPFGEAGTLQACALVTDVIKRLPVKLCGYSGLMLPVLEDTVLARRASEGRYGLRDLLLFSSVCGTGLDVVPLPGDTPAATLERIMLDVAAQAVKLSKALSVRLFLVPGKGVGDECTSTTRGCSTRWCCGPEQHCFGPHARSPDATSGGDLSPSHRTAGDGGSVTDVSA